MNVITSNKELKLLYDDIIDNSDKIIAIDTEFVRKFTYFPFLCLIQIAYYVGTELKLALIDTVAQPQFSLTYFFKLLKSNKITKVLYSCSQDIDAISSLKKTVKINNLEDVQLMACFCGEESISYNNAVKKFCNVELNKNKNIQTSNWKKRPLSQNQFKYAQEDVLYLIRMYRILKERLIQNNNICYYENEIRFLLKSKSINSLISNAWKKLKFCLHKCQYRDIELIKKLAAWRERRAIESNVIRSMILTDDVLMKLSEIKPTSTKLLKDNFIQYKDILVMPKQLKNELVALILNSSKQLAIKSRQVSEDTSSFFYVKARNFTHKDILFEITDCIKKICKSKHINPILSLTQYEVIALIMKYEPKKKILYGWKYVVFNKIITHILNKYSHVLSL